MLPPRHLDLRVFLACALLLPGCGARPASRLTLRHVVLYQNGIGYFEHTGQPERGRIELAFRPHEIGDVLKTITIVSTGAGAGVAATVSATVPRGSKAARSAGPGQGAGAGAGAQAGPDTDAVSGEGAGAPDRIAVAIALEQPAREVAVSYAVPD